MIKIPDSIFPKNEQGEKICPKCTNILKACTCPSYDPSKHMQVADGVVPVLKVDRTSRKGKTVIVISSLPSSERYLKALSRKIKIRTGSGGTFYVQEINSEHAGVIEVQGDKSDLVQKVLMEEGIKKVIIK